MYVVVGMGCIGKGVYTYKVIRVPMGAFYQVIR